MSITLIGKTVNKQQTEQTHYSRQRNFQLLVRHYARSDSQQNDWRASLLPRRQFIDDGQLAGAVTVVARHGKVAHFEAYGMMDIAGE